MCTQQLTDAMIAKHKGGDAGSGQGVGTLMAMGDTLKAKPKSSRLQRQGSILPTMAAFGTSPKLSGTNP